MATSASSGARLAPSDTRVESRNRSRSRSPQPKKKSKGLKTIEKVKDHDIFLLPTSDYNVMAGLTALAAAVRLFRIWEPSSVVFDEVHFGGFATKYIKGKFFMDVHPPLAKMLIALVGWLAGFTGDFDFKTIGKDYLEPGVPYVYMRLLPAIMGILVVPMMFLTLKAAGCSTATATLGAGFITFENGLLTQARLILLDSPLVMFTALTTLCWTSFLNVHAQGSSQAFSPIWWFWLACTGLSLGATVSVKWVGLFTITWVGVLTVLQLWSLLGDTKSVPVRLWLKHFFARAFCLIVIPVAFYTAMFAIHFYCLVNPGDGDGFMSSAFQSTLNSKGMDDVPADVVFGSRVAIRHWNTQGGYLHSHLHMYPAGSKQQQVTLYPHKDSNNIWVFENETIRENGDGIGGFDDLSPPIFIEDGAKVRLYHIATDKRLHSHDVKPPITEAEWQFEVSAYGYKGFEGDTNDVFHVEIIPHLSDSPVAKQRLRTIQTKFKLIHTMTGCVLFSHKVKLPDWAFEQQEVTCARGATLPNSVWYIESNEHPQLQGDVEKVNYKKPGFFGKFWELNKVMWRTNAGLVDSHAWDSRPEAWPFLKRGINFWGKDHRQIYLIGNPLIWWSSTAAIVIYAIFKIIALLRWQRGYNDYEAENWKRFDYELGASVLGWALHYFPFYLMKRQLFLHHYFPALYFAIAAFCQIFDFTTFRVKKLGLRGKPTLGWILAILFLAFSALVFSLYQPLAYGSPWTKSQCLRVKLFSGWDWDCNNFYDSYDEYSISSPLPAAQPTGEKTADDPEIPVPVAGEANSIQATTLGESLITSQPKSLLVERVDDGVVRREENVEYRDEHGNILDEEEVKALEGKVEFHTRYETKIRYLDEYGNELPEDFVPLDEVPHDVEEPTFTVTETKTIELDPNIPFELQGVPAGADQLRLDGHDETQTVTSTVVVETTMDSPNSGDSTVTATVTVMGDASEATSLYAGIVPQAGEAETAAPKQSDAVFAPMEYAGSAPSESTSAEIEDQTGSSGTAEGQQPEKLSLSVARHSSAQEEQESATEGSIIA